MYGKKPCETARSLSTEELAKLIMRPYGAGTLSTELLVCYSQHVALLVGCMHARPSIVYHIISYIILLFKSVGDVKLEEILSQFEEKFR